MKHKFIYALFSLAILAHIWMGHAIGAGKVLKKNLTGSPLNTETCGKCHNKKGAYDIKTTLTLLDANNKQVTKYKGDQTYTLNVVVTGNGLKGGPAAPYYGFQAVALNNQNNSAGTFTVPSIVQMIDIDGRSVIEHKTPKEAGTWSVTWKAPAKNSGPVKFYMCGVACDGNKAVTNDTTATTVLTLQESVATSNEILHDFSVKKLFVSNNVLQAELDIARSDEYRFEIIDINGNLLYSTSEKFATGEISKELDVSNISAGVYILSVSNRVESTARKFFKNN